MVRLPAGRLMGGVLAVFGVLMIVYGIGSYVGGQAPMAGLFMGVVSGALFVLIGVRFGIVPFLHWNDLGIRVRNPFRTYEVDWREIAGIDLRPSTPTKVFRRGLAIKRKCGSTIVVWVVRKDSIWPWTHEGPRVESLVRHLQALVVQRGQTKSIP